MKILGIEHIAIATESLDTSAPFWRDVLGIEHIAKEVVKSEGVTTDIYDTKRGKVELLSALGDESLITKFLRKRGPGLHHICFEVDNIKGAILELKEKGIRLIKEEPSIGSEGCLYIFIHPESTGGVLVELCQKT